VIIKVSLISILLHITVMSSSPEKFGSPERTRSPGTPHSPKSRGSSPNKSPKKDVTRYGPVSPHAEAFGTEERFRWQKPQFSSDVVYNVPVPKSSRDIRFPTSTRKSISDAEQFATGPGQYDVSNCFDHLSEVPTKRSSKFGIAARPSMDMKTPSPGAVYNVGKTYWNGPEKTLAIGFNCDTRKSPGAHSETAEADIFVPKAQTGPAITIAKRFEIKNAASTNPGPIYDVLKYNNFQTGPKFSFGMNRQANRFCACTGFTEEG
jgi:hypothetical protein